MYCYVYCKHHIVKCKEQATVRTLVRVLAFIIPVMLVNLKYAAQILP